MINPTWTSQRIEELERLWSAGLSGSMIADRMALSRNAVIGKANRLGLAARAERMAPQQQEQKLQERNAARVIRARNSRNENRGSKVREPTIPVKAPAFIGSLNIPFADLRRQSSSEPNQCRFIAAEPAGPEYLACGNETLPGEAWCGHCKGIVFSNRQTPQNVSDAEQARRAAMFRRGGSLPNIHRVAGSDLSEEAA